MFQSIHSTVVASHAMPCLKHIVKMTTTRTTMNRCLSFSITSIVVTIVPPSLRNRHARFASSSRLPCWQSLLEERQRNDSGAWRVRGVRYIFTTALWSFCLASNRVVCSSLVFCRRPAPLASKIPTISTRPFYPNPPVERSIRTFPMHSGRLHWQAVH